MKWMLWNDRVDMAEFGMTRVRIGLLQWFISGRIKASGGGRVLDRLERADRYPFDDLAEDASTRQGCLDRMHIGSVA